MRALKINPQVETVWIGRGDLIEVEILPLSMADQIKLSGKIVQAIQMYFVEGKDTEDDLALVSFFSRFIQDNIDVFLSFVIRPKEPPFWWELQIFSRFRKKFILNRITNDQVIEIGELVYKYNYENLLKKVKGLLEKAGSKQGLGALFPSSYPATEDSDQKTSSEDPGLKAG